MRGVLALCKHTITVLRHSLAAPRQPAGRRLPPRHMHPRARVGTAVGHAAGGCMLVMNASPRHGSAGAAVRQALLPATGWMPTALGWEGRSAGDRYKKLRR